MSVKFASSRLKGDTACLTSSDRLKAIELSSRPTLRHFPDGTKERSETVDVGWTVSMPGPTQLVVWSNSAKAKAMSLRSAINNQRNLCRRRDMLTGEVDCSGINSLQPKGSPSRRNWQRDGLRRRVIVFSPHLKNQSRSPCPFQLP